MDHTNSHRLKETLLALPMTLEAKVQLWLTYKGLKPVSTVQFLPDITPEQKNMYYEWLEIGNLLESADHKSDEFVFVSKTKTLSQRAADIMWSESKDDLIQKGELFGYPKEATVAYAAKQEMKVVTPSNLNKYYAAYVRYLVRPEHVLEDTEIAMQWADIIRTDLPNLAAQFEEEMKTMKVR